MCERSKDFMDLSSLSRKILRGHVAPKGWRRGYLKRHLTLRILSFRPLERCIMIALATFSTVLGFVSPYFQKLFLDTLLGHGSSLPSFTFGFGTHQLLVLAITLAFVGMMVTQFINVILRVFCAREGVILNGQLSREFYLHSLRLTGQARRTRTVGELVALFTTDVSAAVSLIEDFTPSALSSLIPLVLAPFVAGIYFNMPTAPLVMMLCANCGLLFFFSYRQSNFFASFKKLAGDRLAIVNEWLQNMRIIRILGWTEKFESDIQKKRVEETGNRIKMVTNGSTMNSIAQVAPLIMNVVGILVLTAAHREQVSPGDVFALLWIFGVFLARPIRNLPWTLVIFMDGRTSCKRLERFFSLAEEPFDKDSLTELDPAADMVGSRVRVRGLSLVLDHSTILRDINFDAEPGEFIAIIGEVGAGKSQFISALLRDSPGQFDEYFIDDQDALKLSLPVLRNKFTFVPQDGFTMSASIRDNVAFAYNTPLSQDQRIEASLKLAAFEPVKELTEGSLATEIGERGVNLSGGQRQRVSLARAHFHRRGIVILDDSLSAVDVDTEQKLVQELLLGAWKNATRILVTHRMSVLNYVDKVYLMDRGRLRIYDGSK